MRVLVACEFSGRVRNEFAAKGHDAWSCDLIDSELPGHHLKCNVLDVLSDGWDLMIAFPPCTFLAKGGARWWKDRLPEQELAAEFVMTLAAAPIDKIAIENPIGALPRYWRKYDQIIQPWQHGYGVQKATCLWLKNLALLVPTNIVAGRYPFTEMVSEGPDRTKIRSRTFKGIARAMAAQWG